MQPSELFTHCPRCGAPAAAPTPAGKPFACAACGFRFYFNAACAVFGLLEEDGAGRVLFLRREKDPGAGKRGFPGGFVDLGESAEEALRREAFEETGLRVDGPVEYLASHANPYHYGGVTYPVLDLAFVVRVSGAVAAAPLTLQTAEVRGAEWLDPRTVSPDEIAFGSQASALRLYLERRSA
jgi:ADP-ribose pyrophosphatase YjhB (NUDIX family)